MKKLLTLGLSAVLVALASSRPANAWINSKFSVGLNWNFQSGNNCTLWGLFKDGATPDGGYPGEFGPGPGAFPYFGSAPQTMPPASSPTPQVADTTNYGNNNFYNTSYQPNYQPSYGYPSYGYPSYGYSGYGYPSYYSGYSADQFMWFYQR